MATYTRVSNQLEYHDRYALAYGTYVMDRARKEYVDSYYEGLAHPWLWGTLLLKMGRTVDSEWLNDFSSETREALLASPLDRCQEVQALPQGIIRGKKEFDSMEDLCSLGPWLEYYDSNAIFFGYMPIVEEIGPQPPDSRHMYSYILDDHAVFSRPTLSEEYRRDLFFHSWRTSITPYVVGKATGSLEYLIEKGNLDMARADPLIEGQVSIHSVRSCYGSG